MTEKLSYYDVNLIKSDTVNGHDWAIKALHPPGSKGASYNGYPDKSVVSAIHSEYRQQFEALPAFKDNPANEGILLFTPGLFFPVWAAGSKQNTQSNEWRTPYENVQLKRTDLGTNFSKRRCAYKSTTIELDSTAFTNQGMFYLAEFHPSIEIIDGEQALIRYANCPKSARIIKDFLKRNINNDKFEIIGATPTIPNINARSIQIVKLGSTIKTPTDVTMASPKSYFGRATEGMFAVQQVNEPTNEWRDLCQARYSGGVANTNEGTYLTVYEQQHDTGGATLYYLFDEDGSTDNYRGEVDMRGWSWKMLFFQNISTFAENSPYFAFKIIHGEEWATAPRGFLNSLAMPPALYDRSAIDCVALITQARQDGMPAKYNAAGLLANVAASVAPALIGSLVQAVTPKAKQEDTIAAIEKAKSTDISEAAQTTQHQADSMGTKPANKPIKTMVFTRKVKRTPKVKATKPNRSVVAENKISKELARINKQLKSLAIKPKGRKTNKKK